MKNFREIVLLSYAGLCALQATAVEKEPAIVQAALAGDLKAVKAAIKRGDDLNAQRSPTDLFGIGGDGDTALMVSAERGEVALVKTLLDAGADPKAEAGWDQPHAGHSALSLALRNFPERPEQGKKIIRLLLDAGAPVNTITDGYWAMGRYDRHHVDRFIEVQNKFAIAERNHDLL
jgi:hypothetical protein